MHLQYASLDLGSKAACAKQSKAPPTTPRAAAGRLQTARSPMDTIVSKPQAPGTTQDLRMSVRPKQAAGSNRVPADSSQVPRGHDTGATVFATAHSRWDATASCCREGATRRAAGATEDLHSNKAASQGEGEAAVADGGRPPATGALHELHITTAGIAGAAGSCRQVAAAVTDKPDAFFASEVSSDDASSASDVTSSYEGDAAGPIGEAVEVSAAPLQTRLPATTPPPVVLPGAAGVPAPPEWRLCSGPHGAARRARPAEDVAIFGGLPVDLDTLGALSDYEYDLLARLLVPPLCTHNHGGGNAELASTAAATDLAGTAKHLLRDLAKEGAIHAALVPDGWPTCEGVWGAAPAAGQHCGALAGLSLPQFAVLLCDLGELVRLLPLWSAL